MNRNDKKKTNKSRSSAAKVKKTQRTEKAPVEITKVKANPMPALAPLPVIMATCGDMEENNIITIGWTGIVNSNPPMTYISVRKERNSHHMIKEHGEFVINLVHDDIAYACDWCGVKSGKDFDKFKEMNLTRVEGDVVKAPLIKESKINIECRVTQVIELGSHDMFLAEIVAVHIDSDLVDENGAYSFDNMTLVSYCHGHYYKVSRKPIGKFGYSVMKPKTLKRLRREEHERRAAKKKQL